LNGFGTNAGVESLFRESMSHRMTQCIHSGSALLYQLCCLSLPKTQGFITVYYQPQPFELLSPRALLSNAVEQITRDVV